MKSFYRIALTGGAAAGKSSVLRMLKQMRTNEKIKVIFLDETATVFFHNRPAAVSALDSPLLRQHYIVKTQTHIEDLLLEYAVDSERPTVIVSDRGAADAMVYLSDEDFNKLGIDANNLISRYDFVIHLEGSENNFVHNDSTTTRIEENYDEVNSTANRSRHIWSKHKSFSVICQKDTIEEKVTEVVKTINALIGTEVFVL